MFKLQSGKFDVGGFALNSGVVHFCTLSYGQNHLLHKNFHRALNQTTASSINRLAYFKEHIAHFLPLGQLLEYLNVHTQSNH
jgi:hypothetical protein